MFYSHADVALILFLIHCVQFKRKMYLCVLCIYLLHKCDLFIFFMHTSVAACCLQVLFSLLSTSAVCHVTQVAALPMLMDNDDDYSA